MYFRTASWIAEHSRVGLVIRPSIHRLFRVEGNGEIGKVAVKTVWKKEMQKRIDESRKRQQ